MSNEKRLWIIEARDGAWGANGICKGELVRCKDCKWFAEFTHNGEPTGHGSCNNPQNGWGRCPQADWFCADGEDKNE